MSSADLNKIAGAGLTALLVATVIGHVGNALVTPTLPDEAAYRIETGVATAAPEAPPQDAPPPAPITPLLAAADAAAGAKLAARRCGACHGFDAGGPAKVGPNLHGIVGRALAADAGFSYSQALSARGGSWGYEELNGFLVRPKSWAPGTKMSFVGLRKESERAQIIAYLRSISDAAPPLPGE